MTNERFVNEIEVKGKSYDIADTDARNNIVELNSKFDDISQKLNKEIEDRTQDISGKFDKSGGTITGEVNIENGNLTINGCKISIVD